MVLDSSALLAYLHQEQGGLQVRPWLQGGLPRYQALLGNAC